MGHAKKWKSSVYAVTDGEPDEVRQYVWQYVRQYMWQYVWQYVWQDSVGQGVCAGLPGLRIWRCDRRLA